MTGNAGVFRAGSQILYIRCSCNAISRRSRFAIERFILASRFDASRSAVAIAGVALGLMSVVGVMQARGRRLRLRRVVTMTSG